MTTKEAITKYIECANYTTTKHIAIMEWLDDINWHNENARYMETLPDELQQEITKIQEYKTNTEIPHYDPIRKQAEDIEQTLRYLPGVALLTGWGFDDSFKHSWGLGLILELQEIIKRG